MWTPHVGYVVLHRNTHWFCLACNDNLFFTVNHTGCNVKLDLVTGNFGPFIKPGNKINYVHSESNHPPLTLKAIPKGINKRLSTLSANETIFNEAKNIYQSALKDSGFDFELKYDQDARTQNKNSKNKNRKRKIVWFNPPYCKSLKTNIGKEFIKIISESFPKSHKLHKIFNRNSIKISYCCLPNIGSKILSDTNKKYRGPENPDTNKKYRGPENPSLGKNCISHRNNTQCPVEENKCNLEK